MRDGPLATGRKISHPVVRMLLEGDSSSSNSASGQ